jgi:anti-sigma regulatory factor (Ser/Thr protein kinase)
MTARLARSLAPDPGAASLARRCLNDIEATLPPSVRRDVALLISELVTNAVRHAGASSEDSIELSIDVGRSRVRVDVTDPGPGFEVVPMSPTKSQSSGWGLYLVSRLSDRWGVDRAARGTSVWFEVDIPKKGRRTAAAGLLSP